jgi:hypothetical protein
MSILQEKIIESVLSEYQEIIRSLEREASKSPLLGIPPRSLFVRQIQQYKPEGMCIGEAIAVWQVTEIDIQKISDLSIEPERKPHIGMYFREGGGDFAISPNCRNVIIEWQVGPRYGDFLVLTK